MTEQEIREKFNRISLMEYIEKYGFEGAKHHIADYFISIRTQEREELIQEIDRRIKALESPNRIYDTTGISNAKLSTLTEIKALLNEK